MSGASTKARMSTVCVDSGLAARISASRHHDVLALLVLEAAHDVVARDFLAGVLVDLLVADRIHRALVEQIEANLLRLRRRIELHGHVDQPEADRAFPDHVRHRDSSLEPESVRVVVEKLAVSRRLEGGAHRRPQETCQTPVCVGFAAGARRQRGYGGLRSRSRSGRAEPGCKDCRATRHFSPDRTSRDDG